MKTTIKNRKNIIISNSCSELARERLYPADLLIHLCKELFEKYNCPILLSGIEQDFNYYEQIIKNNLIKELPVENVAGKFSIDEFLFTLYNDCLFLITVDSAPLHYAYRLGVPTVSLWGPTNPVTRMKDSPIFKSVYLAVHCSPCTHQTTVLPCGGDNFCMKNMTTGFVMKKIEEVMSNLH
jgi:ADP-heptose:LPS heptosyltransferase